MRTVHAERTFRAKTIVADAIVTDAGVQIVLFGGDKPHIGAVGILAPDGNITVTEFEGHKEGILCHRWCVELAKAGCTPAVISAGIHYDNAGNEEIIRVVQLCEKLLQDVLDDL